MSATVSPKRSPQELRRFVSRMSKGRSGAVGAFVDGCSVDGRAVGRDVVGLALGAMVAVGDGVKSTTKDALALATELSAQAKDSEYAYWSVSPSTWSVTAPPDRADCFTATMSPASDVTVTSTVGQRSPSPR